jgi:acyl-CoA synthetase (AMP-forming)/AMP-acid ligase II
MIPRARANIATVKGLEPRDLTIAELLRLRAEDSPHAEALLAPGLQPLTYARLWEEVQAAAARLREFGIGRAERVAIVLGDGSHAAVMQAAAACFSTACPMNPAHRRAEYESLFASLRVKAVVVAGEISAAREAARTAGVAVRIASRRVSLGRKNGGDARRIARRTPKRRGVCLSYLRHYRRA